MSKSLSEEIHFAICCISECCVDESKRNITSRKAVEKIREYLSVITDDDRYSKNFNISLKREILQKDQRIAELEKENKELENENNEFCDYNKKLREEKQTEVKEFAEKLKTKIINSSMQFREANTITYINELLKERGIE